MRLDFIDDNIISKKSSKANTMVRFADGALKNEGHGSSTNIVFFSVTFPYFTNEIC